MDIENPPERKCDKCGKKLDFPWNEWSCKKCGFTWCRSCELEYDYVRQTTTKCPDPDCGHIEFLKMPEK